MLVEAHYATYAIGKWHLTPEDECHAGASRARWPLGRGFERFYGFMSGETHQFVPNLVRDNHPVLPPYGPEEGYHLTTDLVDEAISCVRDLRVVDPEKPFFLYFCTGACHSPHQAPPEWIERYRGPFYAGRDRWREETIGRQMDMGVLPDGAELSPRPDWVPAWTPCPPPTAVSTLATWRPLPASSAHGSRDRPARRAPPSHRRPGQHDPAGAVGQRCQLRGRADRLDERRVAVERCIDVRRRGPRAPGRDRGTSLAQQLPMGLDGRGQHPLSSLEAGGARGRGRRSAARALAPPDATIGLPSPVRARDRHRAHGPRGRGLEPPEHIRGVAQSPIEGTSFLASIADPSASDDHRTQYYEMFGCRALYHEGWKAVTYHPIMQTEPGFDADEWELYHVVVDPSECHDRASEEPARLRQMIDRWWIEAARHQVLPLDPRPPPTLVGERPLSVPLRRRYVYYPGAAAVPELVAGT